VCVPNPFLARTHPERGPSRMVIRHAFCPEAALEDCSAVGLEHCAAAAHTFFLKKNPRFKNKRQK
jgi:hypothetical protein